MRILFYCNTYMQIINAVQIRIKLRKESEADIIISDHSNHAQTVCERIRETELFDRVLFLQSKQITYEKKSRPQKLKELIFMCLGCKKGHRSLLWDNIPDYDEIYFFNFDFFIQLLYSTLKDRGSEISVYRFEEGIACYGSMGHDRLNSFYVSKQMKMFEQYRILKKKSVLSNNVSADVVYFPEIYKKFVSSDFNILPIPTLSVHDKEFIDTLNYIFDYKPEDNIFSQRYIYLGTCLDSDGFVINEHELVYKLVDLVGKDNLIVKPHPRDASTAYISAGLNIYKSASVPWELVLLNSDFSDRVFVSSLSGSMVTAPAIIGKNYESYYLYPIIKDKIQGGWLEDLNYYVDNILELLHMFNKCTNCVKIYDFEDIVKND